MMFADAGPATSPLIASIADNVHRQDVRAANTGPRYKTNNIEDKAKYCRHYQANISLLQPR
jgi:hypothetical protein